MEMMLITMAAAIAALVATHVLLHTMLERVDVAEYETALLYRQGRYIRVLEAGRHWIVKVFLGERVHLVDMRLTSHTIAGQDVLTADALQVRLTLLAQYRVGDAITATHATTNAVDIMYEDLQLTLRELVAEKTLEELMKDKSALATALTLRVRERAEAYGLTLHQAGIKDIVLPGTLKALLQSVEEAKQGARAKLEGARAELAATRIRLNTAKMIREHPELMRLRELEVASQAAELKIVVTPQT